MLRALGAPPTARLARRIYALTPQFFSTLSSSFTPTRSHPTVRAQELCERRGGSPGLPAPYAEWTRISRIHTHTHLHAYILNNLHGISIGPACIRVSRYQTISDSHPRWPREQRTCPVRFVPHSPSLPLNPKWIESFFHASFDFSCELKRGIVSHAKPVMGRKGGGGGGGGIDEGEGSGNEG